MEAFAAEVECFLELFLRVEKYSTSLEYLNCTLMEYLNCAVHQEGPRLKTGWCDVNERLQRW